MSAGAATFNTGVVLHAIDKVSPTLSHIAMGFAKTHSAAQTLQNHLNKIGEKFTTGKMFLSAGEAMAAPLGFATKAAMELETALGRVKIATGASGAQMEELNRTLTKTSDLTGIFSKTDLASFAADMYASGITKIGDINKLLPMFAQGADLMKIMSHGKISPEDSAHTFASLAHQFGRYDPESMKPIVEAAVAIAPALPGGLKTLSGMGSYANIMGNRMLGLDPVKLMMLEAAVAQTSGGSGTGRGALSGANVINALERSMPGVFGSGLLTGKSAYAAEVMGLAKGGVSTVFKDGKLDLDSLMGTISSFQKLSGPEIAKKMMEKSGMLGKKGDEQKEFLQNFLHTPGAPKAQLLTQLLKYQGGSASTMMQLFGDEKFGEVLKNLEERIKAQTSIYEMQEEAMKMLEPQLARVKNNFWTLASTVGKEMIPTLTKTATKVGDLLSAMNRFTEKHPAIAKGVVGLVSAVSGLLALGGIGQIVQAGLMGLRFIGAPVAMVIGKQIIGGLGKALSGAALMMKFGAWLKSPAMFLKGALSAGLALMRFAAPLAGIGLAITAVILVVKNWDKVMQFVHEHQEFFIHIAAQAVKAWDDIGEGTKAALGKLKAFAAGIAGFIASIPFMSDVGAELKKRVDKYMSVDDKTAKEDEKFLRGKGFGGLVDGIKGSKPAAVQQTNNVTIQQVPGHDHDACYKNTLKRLGKDTNRASLAGSGNSPSRSIFQGGAVRP